jgi:phage tail-like protein
MKKEQIKRLLPSVFQQTAAPGHPLSAILDVMEAMHVPSEFALEHLHTIFDPYRTPDEFVPYLASWVDLEALLDMPRVPGPVSSPPSFSTGLGRLRELTAAAVTLSQWRGTRKGLQLFLETAMGIKGFEIDEETTGSNGKSRPFHLKITAPEQLAEHRPLLERIIELEKPAYVTYELLFVPGQGTTGTN